VVRARRTNCFSERLGVSLPTTLAKMAGRLSDQDPDFAVGLPPLIFMQVPAGT
jgi:hypothetical protein